MSKKLVEIARSFAYKHNLGNFQSCDFFCSQKAECTEDEAEAKSEALYQFCKKEVLKSLNDYLSLQVDMGGEDYKNPRKELTTVYPKPGEIDKLKNFEVAYRATDKEGGKEKIIKEDLKPY